jgi:uncharacterized protein YjbI with pentapeptide repeats/DNA-binding CsgD family transcriptional regulator
MTRGAHDPARLEWSAREREVLDLIARGRTNGEISELLDISFATAKWHVSELITKLGVSSREEVAEYWRRERSLRRSIGRVLHAVVGLSAVKVAAGGVTVTGLAVMGGVAWGAFGGVNATPDASVTAGAAPQAAATPTPTPTPAPPPPAFTRGSPPACPQIFSRADQYCDYKNYPDVVKHDKGSCDLAGAPLSELYLSQIDLHGCNLRGAALRGGLGNSSNFAGSDLTGADLSSGTFAMSDFRGANLARADMSQAVVQMSDFTNANLLDADLTNSIVRGANWRNTTCPDGTNSDGNGGTCLGTLWVEDYWPGAGWIPPVCSPKGMPPASLCAHTLYRPFAGTSPASCGAPGGDFKGADLRWANLKGCDLAGANLAGADLEHASLAGADLSGANLTGAKLFNVDATGANFERARLDRAVVSHTSLAGTNLRGVSTAMTLFRPTLKGTICPDGSSSDLDDGDSQSCESNR